MILLKRFHQLCRKMQSTISQYDTLKKKVKGEEKPLKCFVEATFQHARSCTISLPHGDVLSPVFMPVGTKGTMKGLTSEQMEALDCRILLSNTYHLGNKPTGKFLEKVGGLHKFMSWNRNILTDSGGFQMVSLSKLCEMSQQGVKFQNPYDHSLMFIGPEESVHIQNSIGSDIMMALDDVVKTTTVGPRMEQAMQRTVRWIDRNLAANQNPTRQNLFPIVQGGVDMDLRRRCLEELVKRDANGYAIGGLAGGEAKSDFFKIVRYCCSVLPDDKPRYLMGVGYPVDIVLAACLGVDMFDCVYPTRTARFGTAFTRYGDIKLRNKIYAKDFSKIDEDCDCEACSNYTRAYLHMIEKHDNFCHLLSMHNILFLFRLMRRMKKAIESGQLVNFVEEFLNDIYSDNARIPSWVAVALEEAKLTNVKLKYPLYEEKIKQVQQPPPQKPQKAQKASQKALKKDNEQPIEEQQAL